MSSEPLVKVLSWGMTSLVRVWVLVCVFDVLVIDSCDGVEGFVFLGMSKVNFLACCPSVGSLWYVCFVLCPVFDLWGIWKRDWGRLEICCEEVDCCPWYWLFLFWLDLLWVHLYALPSLKAFLAQMSFCHFFMSISLLNASRCVFNLSSLFVMGLWVLNCCSLLHRFTISASKLLDLFLYSSIKISIKLCEQLRNAFSHLPLNSESRPLRVGKIWTRNPKGLMSSLM